MRNESNFWRAALAAAVLAVGGAEAAERSPQSGHADGAQGSSVHDAVAQGAAGHDEADHGEVDHGGAGHGEAAHGERGHDEAGHTHAAGTSAAKAAESNDRPTEITAESANLWHIKTKTRLLKMRLVRQQGQTFAEILPFTYEGAASPYGAETTLSLEIDPGTDHARTIPLRKEGEGGRMITSRPLPTTAAFDAAIYMDEKDHHHRLRFRFPGAS